MEFKLLASTTLALSHQTQWLWYSASANSFVTGDERVGYSLPVLNPGSPTPLRAESRRHACNLPMPGAMLDEFAAESWHGFQFLPCADYEAAVDHAGRPVGNILRTLVFGPNYNTYVRHRPSGTTLAFDSGSMTMLRRGPAGGGGFDVIDKTKTRGRGALAFAGHPAEPLVAYGDNAGTFHAHRLDAAKFGKATKIAEKTAQRNALEFVADGAILAVGGMGYLATFIYAGGKFAPVHEVTIPVRDFLWLNGGQLVIVNQGLHGVGAYRYDAGSGFTKTGALATEHAVQQIAVSKDARYCATTANGAPTVSVYAIV